MDEMGFDLDWLGFERPDSGTPFANTGQRAGQAKRLKLSKADLEALFEDVSCGDEAYVRWLRIVILRTLFAAAEQPDPCIQPTVLLTRLGGGPFGNPDNWIDIAISRGLAATEFLRLDVKLLSHGTIHSGMRAIETAWDSRPR